MPHATVKMWPGKTEEQKKRLAELIARDMMDVTGAPSEVVSVVIEDVAKDDWTAEVVNKELAPKQDRIYKQPGYPID